MLEYCFGFIIKGLFKDMICNIILVIFTQGNSVFHLLFCVSDGMSDNDEGGRQMLLKVV